jgi:hydrocephalus-inducing protein
LIHLTRSYSAHFEASVVDEGAAKSRELSFEIRGDSTLPHVEVVEPSARGESGIVMTFPRCFVGKRVNLPIRVRNSGLLPASVRLSLRGDDAFALSGEQGQADIPMGDLFETTVSFEPQEAGAFEGELHVNVAKNSYEVTVIHVSGESFFEEVSFDDLPEDEQGTLTLGDISIGSRKQISFTMQNHSKDVVRFQWKTPLEVVEVVPEIGHILVRWWNGFTFSFSYNGRNMFSSLLYTNMKLFISV